MKNFQSLNQDEVHRLGRYLYYHAQGRWYSTTYHTIDEEYEQSAESGNVCTYNLDRAYSKRDFTGQLLSLKKMHYNTTKVPVGALKTVESLSVLKIERPMNEAEWKELAEIETLEELYIVDQGLQEFPQSLCQMKNLRKLFLWGNEFTSLPKEFIGLQNLETLSITGSLLHQSAHDDLFKQMRHLVSIYR